MDDDAPETTRRFSTDTLPWILGAVFLAIYGLTLCRGFNHLNLDPVMQLGGWLWELPWGSPLLYVLLLPARWVGDAAYPMALNVIAALLAAATAWNLARTVSLLPHDRTREQRMRGHSEDAVLHIAWAWLPPVFAAGLFGLQLTAWEHSTAMTGEMLNVLIFAYCIRCLVEYRLDLRETWLYRMAFIYGIGLTNNWALIGFAPLLLVAVVWIRGLSFFDPGFLIRMAVFGLAGLTLYLLMPAIAAASGRVEASFWEATKSVVNQQRLALVGRPRGRFIMLGLIQIAPLIMIGIRWAGTKGASIEKLMTVTAVHLLKLAWLGAIVLLAIGPRQFNSRTLGYGLPLLTFHYLAAIAAGYFVGFFLLVYGQRPTRVQDRGTGLLQALGPVAAAVLGLMALALPAVLVWRNLPLVRDVGAINQVAKEIVTSFPPKPTIAISDNWTMLQLAEAGRRLVPSTPPLLLLHSSMSKRADYREHLAKVYGKDFPWLADWAASSNNVAGTFLPKLADAALQGAAFYLHPSFGWFFEHVYLRPHGLLARVAVYQPDQATVPPMGESELKADAVNWDRIRAWAAGLPVTNHAQAQIAGRIVTRMANFSGVEHQRSGRLEEARRLFEFALTVGPDNFAAMANARVNEALRGGNRIPEGAAREASEYDAQSLTALFGPVDEPEFLKHWSETCQRSNDELFRQAVVAANRAHELAPGDVSVSLQQMNAWLAAEYPDRVIELAGTLRSLKGTNAIAGDNLAELTRLEAGALLRKGDVPGAERLLREGIVRQPSSTSLLDSLSFLQVREGRLDEAARLVEEWLRAKPEDLTGLQRQALILMRTQQFAPAIEVLNKILRVSPENATAMMNRAISLLQLQRTDEALRDYTALAERFPNMYEVQYGLGQAHAGRSNTRRAIEHFEAYLSLAPKGTTEYSNVVQRLAELKAGRN